ncbi:MAG: flagellin [Bryobacterales bacterium]|nr:flagellin [Bryobacterales bacterium]
MAYTINTNISSLQAQDYLRTTQDFQQKTIARVTSGLRIVSSGDDAAGLAIANSFRSDLAVLNQGVRNANDGLSTLQTIDGGINNISKLLDRARTLATQSASSTFTGDRNVLNAEFSSVLDEVNRQAQAIGLDTGGAFAKSLSVFIGGGRASSTSAIANGSVNVDLSQSTVDARSLGLSGMQAVSKAGTDLSTSSAATSVQSVVNDVTNLGSLKTSGHTDFYFKGPGFSDDSRIRVSANLSGVTDTKTMVAAINDAIASSGDGATASATAFKNAGIQAVVVTSKNPDGTVSERIGFTSSTAAFQVAAGDRMSNALLGNFSSGASGADMTTTFVGGGSFAGAGTTAATAGNIMVRFQGGGLAGPVDLKLAVTGGTTTTGQVLSDLTSQVANNAALKAAGITLANGTANQSLVFQNSNGERFTVEAAGDTTNILGLGTYALANPSAATSLDYSSITSGGAWGNDKTLRLAISVNGSDTLIDTGNLAVAGANAAARVTGAVNLLNSYFATDAKAQAAGLRAVDNGSGQVRVESSNGTAFRVNTTAGDATDMYFGGVGATIVANKNDVLRGTADQGAFAGSAGDKLVLNINGTDTTLDISGAANIGAVVTAIDGVAGIGAATVNGRTAITGDSANTKISVVSGSATALAALGLSVGDTNIPNSATVNAGGAYNTALGSDKDVFRFSTERNAGDAQTLNVIVNDSSGAQRSVAVTLQNSLAAGGTMDARSLDEAIKAINSALQSSSDPALKQVVAVKETTYDGRQDGIRFLSANNALRVGVSQVGSSTAAAPVGVYDGTVASGVLGQGDLYGAEQTAGGSQLDISSQGTAESAVTTLANAVVMLGNAQAAIGKGQNQFNYAINLASTQITNLAAAESRIRDADLAAEAANLTKAQILQQAGVAALAQANSAPQAILSLLRG